MFNGSSKGIQGNGYFSGIIPQFTSIEVLKIKDLGTVFICILEYFTVGAYFRFFFISVLGIG